MIDQNFAVGKHQFRADGRRIRTVFVHLAHIQHIFIRNGKRHANRIGLNDARKILRC